MNTALQPTTPRDIDAVLHLDDETLFQPPMLAHALDLLRGFTAPLVADVETDDGRREINRVARAVGGAISRLDERRRVYVAALKARPKAIDDLFRTTFRQPAEALKDQIRAPLTAWEEEIRLADEQTSALIESLNAPIEHGTSAAAIAQRLEAARNLELPDWLSATQRNAIVLAMQTGIPRLEAALTTAQHAEFQAAEVARLREVERQAEIMAAREQAAIQAARVAEEQHRAQVIAAERDAAMASNRILQDAIAKGGPVSPPHPQPVTTAPDRAAVHRAILADLEDFGLSEEQAKRLIVAIGKGQIPHLSITY